MGEENWKQLVEQALKDQQDTINSLLTICEHLADMIKELQESKVNPNNN